jgi:hypothetical protein
MGGPVGSASGEGLLALWQDYTWEEGSHLEIGNQRERTGLGKFLL